jgi:DNA-binding MarR family transcriptional regulator
VEAGLPRELEVDLSYVDEIAVELACRGERVALTPAEFSAAVEILADRRLTTGQIARRLYTTRAAVAAVLRSTAVAGVVATAPSLTRIAA